MPFMEYVVIEWCRLVRCTVLLPGVLQVVEYNQHEMGCKSFSFLSFSLSVHQILKNSD